MTVCRKTSNLLAILLVLLPTIPALATSVPVTTGEASGVPGEEDIFVDDFESGDTTAWGDGGPGENLPPVVTILAPPDGSTAETGQSIAFQGTAIDPEDGDVTPSLNWTSSLDGVIGSGGSFVAALTEGEHLIFAVATDSESAQGEASVSLTITNDDPKEVILPPELTEEDRQLAIQIAEAAMPGNGIPTSGPMYVTRSWPFQDKETEARRIALTHYRYEDQSAVVTEVDIENRLVLSQAQLFDYQTMISLEELQIARDLASLDPQVQKILGPFGGAVESTALRARGFVAEGEEVERHRVVVLLYYESSTGDRRFVDALGLVYVDLEAEQVFIDPSTDP